MQKADLVGKNITIADLPNVYRDRTFDTIFESLYELFHVVDGEPCPFLYCEFEGPIKG